MLGFLLGKASLTTDGQRYIWIAQGREVAMPYHLRWLLPKLLGPSAEQWALTVRAFIVLLPLCVATYVWQQTLSPEKFFFALAATAMIPVLARYWEQPVLVDIPAMFVAMLAAMMPWYVGLPIAIVAGCMRETAPVFAAIYAWNPILLLGLVAPAARRLFFKPGDEPDARVRELIEHPFQTGFLSTLPHVRAHWMILFWGAGLACLFYPTWQLVVALAVAYAQILCAHVSGAQRLAFWAAPVVMLQASYAATHVLVVLLILTWFWPWREEIGKAVPQR